MESLSAQNLPHIRDHHGIRYGLLRQLGMLQVPRTNGKVIPLMTQEEFSSQPRRLLKLSTAYQEQLQYCVEDLQPKENLRVRFQEEVGVVTIRSFDEYSPEMRKRIWTGTEEIERNRIVNAEEFQFDNYDWRAAAEEEDMWEVRGKLLHPVHKVKALVRKEMRENLRRLRREKKRKLKENLERKRLSQLRFCPHASLTRCADT